MAQHDYIISNQGFASYRSDHNSSLSAIVSNNSGATEPTTTYAYQWWYDTTTDILKMRNADNDAWITMFTFNQTADTYSLATDVELTITENLDLTGSATISGDLTVNTDTLYVDSTNNVVGVGTSSPSNSIGFESAIDISSSNGAGVYFRDSDSPSISAYVGYIGSNLTTYVWNQANGPILFGTNDTEAMRIGSNGGVAIGSTSTTVAKLRVDVTGASDKALRLNGINASYTEQTQISNVTRSANSTYQFLLAYSGDTADIEFNIRGDGNGYADGSWNGGGADYAEYFEWSDGNTDNEDRRGYTVILDGNMIRKATDTDNASEIIGVISSDPVVVGDASWNKWTNKHLKDDFGSYIWEEHNVIEWTETDDEGNEQLKSYEDWNIPEGIIVPDDAKTKTHDAKGNRFQHRKVNPDYDPNIEYIPREQRKEWDAVGLMGKLRIRKGQPVGDRWIKMRDISDTVEEWLIR